ncbi:MAG: tyrosine-type recombinase/integrase [Saprospiraceae bacterium]|nr:tyrosine-type recombinase/integrase [Saprospiraceae bacterium]
MAKSIHSKKLTSHIARHSFADIARKKGISVYDISKALGHSSIAITEKYLASLDDGAVTDVFNKMFD